MVGTTAVVSITHNNSPAAQPMALFLQPDTLLQTYLCVCGSNTCNVSSDFVTSAVLSVFEGKIILSVYAFKIPADDQTGSVGA